MEFNKIYHMDCIVGIKKLPDHSIDCICTDPPYFLGMTHNGQKGAFEDLAICKPFFTELAKEFDRVLKPTGTFYFFTDWRGYAFYYPILAEYLPVKNLVVWDKVSGPGSYYAYIHELIIYGCKKEAVKPKGSNVWKIPGFSSGAKRIDGEKQHPTQKPTEVIERIILDGSPENGVVLDTFSGSGTTAAVCVRNKRQFIGFEIKDEYFELSLKRVEEEIKSQQASMAAWSAKLP